MRSEYAMALISLEEQKIGVPAIYTSFSKSPIEERIGAIMKSKKLTATAFTLSAILVIGTATVFATSEEITSIAESSGPYQNNKQDDAELLNSYKEFGISYDIQGNMYFKGEAVRYFWDGYEFEKNLMSRYEFYNGSGTIDVHTVRNIKDNGDGSIDPFGDLTDIRSYSNAEFDARDTAAMENPPMETTAVEDNSNTAADGRTFEQIFADYKTYGITYKSGGSGLGNVYLNGELVQAFVDEKDGGVFSFHSMDGGSLVVRTVYDENGNLTGLKSQ